MFKLSPGEFHDPIRCDVILADLKTCGSQYEALSYVWGAPEGQLRIQIDDAGFEIQPNLHRALVDLRSSDKSRCLWIDAICINQLNTSERNTQVPLMCDIYRSASQTICYLGPEMKETRKAYAMLHELAEEGKMHQANDATTVASFINHVPINPVQSSLREKYLADDTILHVASCEWWFRAWTVQESLLSHNAVMVIGRRSMEWRNFCAAVDHGFNIQIWSPVHFGFIKDEIIVPYLSLRALTNRQRCRQEQLSSPAHELLNLLIHCRHRASKDPRDKIYALLGLLHDAEFQAMNASHPQKLCIKPDYNLPLIDVYRQVSQELIEKLDNLDVLGVTPRSALPGLPSWVTDWSVTDYISSPLTQDSMDRYRTTHASKGTRGSFRFLKDGRTIVLNGCELTSVHQIADSLRYMKCTTGLMPTNLKTPEPEPIHKDTLEANPVEAINQEDKDSNSTMTTFEQLVATAKEVYKNTEEQSQGALQRLRHIPESLQDFADRFNPERYEKVLSLQDFANTFQTLFVWETFSRAHRPASRNEKESTKQADNLSDLYWHTLCAGTYQDGSVGKTKALFDEWSQRLQPIRSLFENHPQAVEKMPSLVMLSFAKAFWTGYSPFWPYISSANGRRLGRAVNGWLCLLPGETEVGDKIILARGGRVPLVIRPLTDDEECFSLVGEAYIHGIMDGEAFVEEECKDFWIR
ncbi:heterokaryon incompatibility protein-domain-containing protein [Diaporthe sp. PMI_573]|nr:heterokaryon incompatibility protein-domain-containing protein [Diaporthaceae sp. PMI_573]